LGGKYFICNGNPFYSKKYICGMDSYRYYEFVGFFEINIIIQYEDYIMLITRQSAISNITRTLDIPVNPEDYMLWQSGLASIQEAMPYLTDAHREYILSGITPEEWAGAFLEYAD
jgi:hypothetical protein